MIDMLHSTVSHREFELIISIRHQKVFFIEEILRESMGGDPYK